MFLLSLSKRFFHAVKVFRTALIEGNYTHEVVDETDGREKLQSKSNQSDKSAGSDNEELRLTCQLQGARYLANGQPLTDQSIQEWASLNNSERIQRNSEHLNKNVLSWSELLDKNGRLGVNEYYYVFLHVPKAGGTTLKDIIAKNYPPQHCVHSHAPETIKNSSMLFSQNQNTPLNVIMGHQHMSSLLYQLLLERPIVNFTMFREPARRIISHFNFIKRGVSPTPAREQIRNLTFEEYVQLDIPEVNNGQAMRILGLRGKKEVGQLNEANKEELLAEIKQTLEQRFTFFGVLENFDEFVIMARKVLGWSDIFYTRRNVSDNSKKVSFKSLDESTLQIIYERNWLDIELYNFACKLFRQRCEELGITAQVVDTYKQLSEDYGQLMANNIFK